MVNVNPLTEGTVRLNKASLYYKMTGKGEPVIILHGGPGGDHNLMLPFQELADAYQVIFYDQRGTGHSDAELNSDSINVANFIQDLESLRTELGLGKVHLLGHSWGSVLGMLYAMEHSDWIRTLTLFGTPGASTEFFPVYFQNMEKNTDPDDKERLAAIKATKAYQTKDAAVMEQYTRILFKSYFRDKSLVNDVNFTLGPNTVANQQAVGTLLMQDLGNFNYYDCLNKITCPTLIIQGADDLFPTDAAFKTHQHIPGSKLIVQEHAGHLLFIDNKEPFFDKVRLFMSDPETVQNQVPEP